MTAFLATPLNATEPGIRSGCWPPGEMTARLGPYANEHGTASGWPYYSIDGHAAATAKEWDALRHKWHHVHGLTNVWRLPPLHGVERIKGTMRRAAPRVHNPSSLSAAQRLEHAIAGRDQEAGANAGDPVVR